VGAYFGVLGGLLYDQCGPRVTLLVGAIMHASGYLGVWSVLTKRAGFRSGVDGGARQFVRLRHYFVCSFRATTLCLILRFATTTDCIHEIYVGQLRGFLGPSGTS
jgi:hypothetical protein